MLIENMFWSQNPLRIGQQHHTKQCKQLAKFVIIPMIAAKADYLIAQKQHCQNK